jgi:hypothetical protein
MFSIWPQYSLFLFQCLLAATPVYSKMPMPSFFATMTSVTSFICRRSKLSKVASYAPFASILMAVLLSSVSEKNTTESFDRAQSYYKIADLATMIDIHPV